jgi:prepilin-type processing-associated H-X9-DG protein
MSNELSTPKILYCPSDNGTWGTGSRGAATNFVTFDPSIAATPKVSFQYLSYFVCGDTMEAYPSMILDGDRNIGQATALGTAANSTNVLGVAWNGVVANSWAWDITSQHLKNGNCGMADGSVAQLTISALQTALTQATNGEPSPNPYYNFPQGTSP